MSSFASHLSAGPCYFVNDVSKHNVLVVSFCANFLPLWVFSQPNVVTKKWVAYAGIKGRHKGYDLMLSRLLVVGREDLIESFLDSGVM